MASVCCSVAALCLLRKQDSVGHAGQSDLQLPGSLALQGPLYVSRVESELPEKESLSSWYPGGHNVSQEKPVFHFSVKPSEVNCC